MQGKRARWDKKYLETNATKVFARMRHRRLDQHISAEITREELDQNLLQAVVRGFCPLCPGVHKYPRLYKHVTIHAGIKAWADFLRKLELPLDTPPVTQEQKRQASESKDQFYGTPAGEIAKEKLSKANTGKSRPGARSQSRWEIAIRRCRGESLIECADALGLAGENRHSVIQDNSERVGLAFGAAFVSDFGEPFSHHSLTTLRRASGLDARHFALRSEIEERQVAAKVYRFVRPKVGSKVIAWRDSALRELLRESSLSIGRKSFRADAVIKTLMPGIVSANTFLLATIGDIRQQARENPEWKLSELGERICEHAQFEKSQRDSASDMWQKTLRFMCEISEWLGQNLDRLRGSEADGPFVRAMIGSRIGANANTIQNALRERTKIISPEEICTLIIKGTLTSASVNLETEPKALTAGEDIGAPTKNENEKTYFKIGQLVEGKIGRLAALIDARRALPRKIRRQTPKVKAALTKAGFNENEINAGLKAQSEVIGARHYVSATEELDYDTVAKYHRDYLDARSG